VFVSGAVLGVNTQHADLSFFPDIYNEDWFFFARHAAERSLPKVGEVRQDEYPPFADPTRATREEFGDLLAEGLYSLFESTRGWAEQMAAAVTPRYWSSFRADRKSFIDEVRTRLEDGVAAGNLGVESAYRALESLAYAEKQLTAITDDRCAEFIESWHQDEVSWRRSLPQRRAPLGERDALDELGFGRDAWFSCGYGAPAMTARMPVGV
jgi:hypothetical protein